MDNGINWLMESNFSRFTSVRLLYLYLTKVEAHSLICIIWLMGSVMGWPKVIPLSGVHCTYFSFNFFLKLSIVGGYMVDPDHSQMEKENDKN